MVNIIVIHVTNTTTENIPSNEKKSRKNKKNEVVPGNDNFEVDAVSFHA